MFVHSPTDGHLHYFPFGAMMNNAATNIHAHALSLCGCQFSLKIKVFDFDSKSKNQNQIKKFKVLDFDSSKLVFFPQCHNSKLHYNGQIPQKIPIPARF